MKKFNNSETKTVLLFLLLCVVVFVVLSVVALTSLDSESSKILDSQDSNQAEDNNVGQTIAEETAGQTIEVFAEGSGCNILNQRKIVEPSFSPQTLLWSNHNSAAKAAVFNYNAPATTVNERVIGFEMLANDGGKDWDYKIEGTYNNGLSFDTYDMNGICEGGGPNLPISDNWEDLCTGKTSPVTGEKDSHELIIKDASNQVKSVRLSFGSGESNEDGQVNYKGFFWIIATCEAIPTPTQTPPPNNLCTITETSYKSNPVNKTINTAGATENFVPPTVTGNQRVVGLNIVMNDSGDDWAYKPTITLNDGQVIRKESITNPCLASTNKNVVPKLGNDWIDVCTKSAHPITGKIDSHELKLLDLNNGIKTVNMEFRPFKDVDDPVRIFEIEWIIADCNTTPPPIITPVITPTDPQNLCTIKATNYVDAPNFTEIVTSTKNDKRVFTPPTVLSSQRVIGVNLIMNDSGDEWVYKPSITLSDGQVVTKSGLTHPCINQDDNVKEDGFDTSVWIDVCTGQSNPATGKIDVHELKLKDANTVLNSVNIELDVPDNKGSVRIYGLEWIIADCAEGGAIGECKVVPSVINPATSIKNGEKRISAVDKYKLTWTKPEIGNTECAYVNSEIYFTQRDSNTGACNYPTQPITTISDINQTELEINDFQKYGNYLLNWNKDYCWKIKNNIQKLKVFEVVSNRETKIRQHDASVIGLIPFWIKYDGVLDNSPSWVNANTVYDNKWSICTVTSQTWRPSGADPNVPSNCFNVNTFIFMNPNGDENIYPRIIQSTNNSTRPANSKDVFRRKFTIPQNAIVTKLSLYSASDSVASYWINEKPVNNIGGSLTNKGICGSSTDAGSYRGIYKLDLDPKFVNAGNNILAGNLVNADECNTNSPMGVQFILKAEYADLTDQSTQTNVESANFTFATNKSPVFIRNGMTFDQNFNKSTAIEANIPLGTVKCSFNTGCSIYPSATAPVCFSGNVNSGKADNPVTFWFEYRDPDNDATINENFKHYFVMTKGTDAINNLSSAPFSDVQGGILHNADRDVIIEFDLSGSGALRGQQADKVRLHQSGKYEDPQTKAVRVYYTLEFLPGFETNVYNIYGLFESLAQGSSSTAILADTMDWNLLNKSPQFWTDARKFSQRGAWGVDLEVPVVEPPELIVSGINEFGVNWKVQESGQIGDVTLGCYTTATSIPLQYISPRSANISVTGAQTNPTQCVVDDDKKDFINLLNDGNAANNIYNTKYLINEHKKFGDLGTIISATDRACNVSEPKTTEATKVQDNWVSTRQGTVFLENGVAEDREIEKLGDPKQEKTYFTYDFSGNQKTLFEKASDDLINLSTNFLGANTGQLKLNTSLTREEITGFKDLNEVPLIPELPVQIDSWFKYFEFIQNERSRKSVNSPTITTNDVSQITCGSNEACIYSGLNLTAVNGKTLCDTSRVVFIKGNLTIEDELLNKDDKSACLFVVDGNMEVKNTKPVKDREGILLSPYDVLEGYFIVNGKVTFNQDLDVPAGSKGHGDGLFVRGGIVAKQFENKRNLGIRNTIQPPALMIYDPRYLYLLRDEIAVSIVQVRETGFNSDQP